MKKILFSLLLLSFLTSCSRKTTQLTESQICANCFKKFPPKIDTTLNVTIDTTINFTKDSVEKIVYKTIDTSYNDTSKVRTITKVIEKKVPVYITKTIVKEISVKAPDSLVIAALQDENQQLLDRYKVCVESNNKNDVKLASSNSKKSTWFWCFLVSALLNLILVYFYAKRR